MKFKFLPLTTAIALAGCASLYYCKLSNEYPFSSALYPTAKCPFPLVIKDITVECEEDISDVKIAFEPRDIKEIIGKELSNSNIFEKVINIPDEITGSGMNFWARVKFYELGEREDRGYVRYRFVTMDGLLESFGGKKVRWEFNVESNRKESGAEERTKAFAGLLQECIRGIILLKMETKLDDWGKGGMIPVRKVEFAKKGEKIQIAILDFTDVTQSAKNAGYGEAISSMLSTAFVKYRKFTIVERNKINQIVQEQKLTLTGITEVSEIEKIGKLLNIDVIILGSVSKLGRLIVIDVRLVNVVTGEMIFSEQIECSSEEGLPGAVDKLAKKVAFAFE